MLSFLNEVDPFNFPLHACIFPIVTKGLVLFPKYNVFVLFLRFPGRGQIMDAVTVDNHHGQTS